MWNAFVTVWKQIPKNILYVIYVVICLNWALKFLYDVVIENKDIGNLPLLLQMIAIFIIISLIYLFILYLIYSLKTIKKLGILEIPIERNKTIISLTNNKLLSCVLDVDINIPLFENSTIGGNPCQYVQGYCFITNISQKNVSVAAVQINDKYHITSYPFEHSGTMDWRCLIKPNEHVRLHFFGYIPSGIIKNKLLKKNGYSTGDLTIIDNFSNKYKIENVNFLFTSNSKL